MEDTDTTDITMADKDNVINVEICAYCFHSFLILTNTTKKECCLCSLLSSSLEHTEFKFISSVLKGPIYANKQVLDGALSWSRGQDCYYSRHIP